MLFVDVRGSSSLAERMTAADFARLMNRFYKAATDVLIGTDALIDKLVGDEVIALCVLGKCIRIGDRVPIYRYLAANLFSCFSSALSSSSITSRPPDLPISRPHASRLTPHLTLCYAYRPPPAANCHPAGALRAEFR